MKYIRTYQNIQKLMENAPELVERTEDEYYVTYTYNDDNFVDLQIIIAKQGYTLDVRGNLRNTYADFRLYYGRDASDPNSEWELVKCFSNIDCIVKFNKELRAAAKLVKSGEYVPVAQEEKVDNSDSNTNLVSESTVSNTTPNNDTPKNELCITRERLLRNIDKIMHNAPELMLRRSGKLSYHDDNFHISILGAGIENSSGIIDYVSNKTGDITLDILVYAEGETDDIHLVYTKNTLYFEPTWELDYDISKTDNMRSTRQRIASAVNLIESGEYEPVSIEAQVVEPAAKKKSRLYTYGMSVRGYSIGCQPMQGLVNHETDPSDKYYDILYYDRPLTDKEINKFELKPIREGLQSGREIMKLEKTSKEKGIVDLIETIGNILVNMAENVDISVDAISSEVNLVYNSEFVGKIEIDLFSHGTMLSFKVSTAEGDRVWLGFTKENGNWEIDELVTDLKYLDPVNEYLYEKAPRCTTN